MPPRSSTQDELPRVADTLHVRLLDMAFCSIDRTWNAKDVFSSYWRLYMNDRDGAAIDWSGGRYSFAAGRLHFVPAWVRFSCWLDRPVNHLYVHFELLGLAGPAMRALFNRPITLPKDASLERQSQEWTRALDKADPAAASANVLQGKALVYGAMAKLMSQLPAAAAEMAMHSASGMGAIAPALQYIDSRLGEPIDNATLAERCALSEDHFIKVFRTAVGQTPGQFVRERRIVAAAQRLVFTDQTIEQIATATGFADRFHFSRAFSHQMGISPAAYRKRPRA